MSLPWLVATLQMTNIVSSAKIAAPTSHPLFVTGRPPHSYVGIASRSISTRTTLNPACSTSAIADEMAD